jgi:hypothetical protein
MPKKRYTSLVAWMRSKVDDPDAELRMQEKDGEKKNPKRGEYALMSLILGALVGWGLMLAFALATTSPLKVFGVASMVAASSMLAGAFFGFIFGVPRTLQKVGEEESDTAKKGETKSSYRPNTNLEQISDWLTKILVGAGLTQIAALRKWLGDVATSLAPGFGTSADAPVFATVTVLSYLLNGFLIGYLWTRLYLAGALQEEDAQSLAREIKEIREQSDLDAKAIGLVLRQLNPSASTAPPTQQELNDAIRDASPNVKAQMFYQAAAMRQENWEDPSKKAKMARTIPVFRALIACDRDDEFHRNYGQLGYALKDQRPPDWANAEAALTKAIQIRGSGVEHNWVFYEFNRALCRINLDENFKLNQKSSSDVTKRIVEDLQVAFSDHYTADVVVADGTIRKWVDLNNINVAELQEGNDSP